MSFFFRKHTTDGLETPDPTPIEVPAGLHRPLTLAEQLARFTASSEAKEQLARLGADTFDEADDLDVDEEGPRSPYEKDFLGSEMPHVQTRLDEQRGGMVEELPEERAERAKGWFKQKGEAVVKSVVPPEVKS